MKIPFIIVCYLNKNTPNRVLTVNTARIVVSIPLNQQVHTQDR